VKSNGVLVSMPLAPFGSKAAIVCESLMSFSLNCGVELERAVILAERRRWRLRLASAQKPLRKSNAP
jgi:hypothetical protein